MRRRRTMGGLVAIGAMALAVWCAWPSVKTAAFLADMSGAAPVWRRWLPVRTFDVRTRDLRVPTRDGLIEARLYTPAHAEATPVVVFPGIHAGGVDEPRLDLFARRLAGTGLTVLSVPLPDLRVFSITSRSTDMIEDTLVWMSDPARTASGRVGVVGVSFSGGLSLVAAGRPSLRGRIAAVVSLGGHADLPRTMRYLCTGQLPDGSIRPPHEYGAAVILIGEAPSLVPPAQVQPLEQSARSWLNASSLASTDPEAAETLFAQARRQSAQLAEPARTLMHELDTHDLARLGPALLPYVDTFGSDPALSPDRSPVTDAPVFLLHGVDDNVIPSTEMAALAADLRARGHARVTALLTPILTHATLQPHVGAGDAWALVRFWREVFATAVLP